MATNTLLAPIVLLLLLVSPIAFASADSINSETSTDLKTWNSESFSSLSDDVGDRRNLASNPYKCTKQGLNTFQRKVSAALDVLYSKAYVVRGKVSSRSQCRLNLNVGLAKINLAKKAANTYGYVSAEKRLQEFLTLAKACKTVKGYSSVTGAYDTALTYSYAAASCYYYLYPSPVGAPPPK